MVTNRTGPVQRVVLVDSSIEALGMLEPVLDAGRYDMVFVESSDRAYTRIKAVRPDLVILCTNTDRLDGFRLLTMLKTDGATRHIPVLTYATGQQDQDVEPPSPWADDADGSLPARQPLRMN